MIWAAGIIGAAGLALALWHMQRPNPPRIAISFARFVPALPHAPSGRARIALVRPRDPLALACLLAAAALAIWALLDADRQYRAERPDHLGLRVVLDLSHSMTLPEGQGTRHSVALQRLSQAQAAMEEAGAGTLCAEIVGVAAQVGPILALTPGMTLPEPLPEGGEPALLTEGARRPEAACALTHVLVLTDQPMAPGDAGGPVLLWDQIGASLGNAGIRDLSLLPGAFGHSRDEIRIEGTSSAMDPPADLQLDTPGGSMTLTVQPDLNVPDRWYALAPYAGPGTYAATLSPGDGYGGDDRVVARLERAAGKAVEWRITALPQPAVLAAGAPLDPLVTNAADLRALDLSRPLLITYPGFGTSGGGQRIGPFLQDEVLFGALNFDALEAALPQAWPGALPEGFAPVMTDAQGGTLIARRARPFGLILPAPRPDLPEPARSLSLTLFFAGLADLLTLPPQTQTLTWQPPGAPPVAEAWRESLTGRPAGPQADLSALTVTGTAQDALPRWPWALAASLALILAERLLRLTRRDERLA